MNGFDFKNELAIIQGDEKGLEMLTLPVTLEGKEVEIWRISGRDIQLRYVESRD